jgi:hypothetical protein
MIPLHYVRCHLLFCLFFVLVLSWLVLVLLCVVLVLLVIRLVVVVVVFVVCVAILRLQGPLCSLIVVVAVHRRQTLHPPWGSNPRPQC